MKVEIVGEHVQEGQVSAGPQPLLNHDRVKSGAAKEDFDVAEFTDGFRQYLQAQANA